LAALVLSFIVTAHFASAFSVSAPEQTFVVPTTSARQIDIPISSPTSETVSVNLIDSKPWTTLLTQQVSLQPDKPQKVSITVSPFIDTQSGLYKLSILFESLSTGELKKVDVFVTVERGEIIDLQRITVTGSLQPLGSAIVQFKVKNLKSITVQDIQVYATIESPSRNIVKAQRSIERLDPGQETSVDIPIAFERQAEAGTYVINGEVRYLDESIKSTQTFFVSSTAVMHMEVKKSPLIFGYKKTIYVTNYGNTAGDELISEVFSPFDTAFLGGDVPSSKSGSVYTWLMRNIQPGETRTISYNIDYTPLFILIIALLLAGWLFFFKLRTVRIRKYILQKKDLEEGEEFTVAVEVKNALGKAVSSEIHDFVPFVFNVKNAEGPKPSKKKTSIGTELVWHVKELKHNEERIYTYKIIPIFGIHGTIKLPRASVTFEHNKKKWENKSFSPSIGLPPAAEGETWKKFLRKKSITSRAH